MIGINQNKIVLIKFFKYKNIVKIKIYFEKL